MYNEDCKSETVETNGKSVDGSSVHDGSKKTYCDDMGFAEYSILVPAKPVRTSGAGLRPNLINLGCMFAMMFVLKTLFRMSRYWAWPIGIAFFSLWIGGMFWLRVRQFRGEDARQFAGKLPVIQGTIDPSRRVWCVGGVKKIRTLLGIGGINDQSFEPIVVKVPCYEFTKQNWIVLLVIFVVCFSLAFVYCYCIKTTMISYAFSAMTGSVVFSTFVTSLVYMNYIRITPGMVETLSYPFLGRGRPRIERCSLRGARVIVDLNQSVVFVQHESGHQTTIRLVDQAKKYEVAHAILLAAISTAEVPRLPEDELVG